MEPLWKGLPIMPLPVYRKMSSMVCGVGGGSWSVRVFGRRVCERRNYRLQETLAEGDVSREDLLLVKEGKEEALDRQRGSGSYLHPANIDTFGLLIQV